jgi:glycosyltransferase involved in cell wall biosynthesis
MTSEPPLVVLVRPTHVSTDSRVKRMAVSLTRLGYRVVVLGRNDPPSRRTGKIGTAQVLLVPPASRLRGPPPRTVRLSPRLRGMERRANRAVQHARQRLDARAKRRLDEGRYLFRRAQQDFATTYGSELVRLAPDVIHVHDPRLLPTAFRAADRMQGNVGRRPAVVYDARENFAGVPEAIRGLTSYHDAVLAAERKWAPRAAAVLTVSAPIAAAIAARLPLPRPPVVVLNAPVLRPTVAERRLRADCGLGPNVPLIVYGGGTRAVRGLEAVVEALVLLAGVHAALIVVPYPNPRVGELTELADSIGVSDRLHVLPPVPTDAIPGYLADADVAISPMLRGPANHEAALPNKLFEYLHAGLPIVTSDVQAMTDFVRSHHLGEVFRSGDSVDLAHALQAVLADPTRYTAGRVELAAAFSWEGQEDALAEAYGHACPTTAQRDMGAFPALEVTWDDSHETPTSSADQSRSGAPSPSTRSV